MPVPQIPAFLQLAQVVNEIVADYGKTLIDVGKISKPSLEILKQANGLTDIQKRGKIFVEEAAEIKANATRIAKEAAENKDLYTSLNKRVGEVKKASDSAKAFADNAKSGKWGALGKLGAFIQVASIAMSAIAYILSIKNSSDIQDLQTASVNVWETQADEFKRSWEYLRKQKVRIDGLDKRINVIDKQAKINDSNQRTTGLRAQQAFTNSVAARELAEQSRKLGNDALYEARQGRKILDGQIQKLAAETGLKIAGLKQQYDAIVKQIGNNANNSVQQTIKQLQDAQQKDTKTVTDSLIKTKESIKKLTTDIQKINSTVTTLRSGLQQTFNVTQSAIKQVVDKGITPVARASTAWGVTVTPATITPATVTISDGGAVTVTPATVTPATVTPAQFSSSAIGQQVAQQIKQETSGTDAKINTLSGANSNLAQAISNVNADLQNTKKVLGKTDINTIDNGARLQIEQLKRENVEQVKQIQKLNGDLQNEQKMNLEGIQKLNNLLGTVNTIGIGVIGIKAVVDAIPSNTINGLKPQIPPLVEQGICNSTRGGCMKGALDQNANDIGNVVNAGNNDLWNKINAGLNGLSLGADSAVMGILNTINGKLGDLIPNGGIAGKLVSGFKWLQIDRALNMLTFATSVHNALMLSSGIGQTLIQALSNVLTLIGIKDDAGNPLDINSIINSTVEGAVKGIVGEENYTKTTETFAKFNRIYQAAINVLNSVQNLSSLILNAVEIVAGNIAIVANALKAAGVVAEKAYGWMNPTPDFENPWAMKLEQLQNAASTIATVTQAPLDVVNASTELTNATNELIKSVKGEGENAQQGTAAAIPDHKATKDKQDTAKTNAGNAAKPNLSDVYNGG
jgi:hypothetical protein